MTQLTDDLSTITTIPKLTLDKLVEKSSWCICHVVEENLLENNPISEVDIGIGYLYIKLESDKIKYKFIPNSKFENSIRETILNKKSPLLSKVEESLTSKIINTYKEFFR